MMTRVPGRGGAADVGLLQQRLEPQLAAGGRGEIGALGLDAPTGPVAGPVADRLDDQMADAVLEDVLGTVRHVFDLAGAPVDRATRHRSARVRQGGDRSAGHGHRRETAQEEPALAPTYSS
jgi:hypothetical protein